MGKFCGAFEAATREKTSGQNKTDVLKHAHEIFFNNYNKKLTLEHAWKELRHDQKWSDLSSACSQGDSKRKKLDNGSHLARPLADDGATRPPDVKAAKARGKKQVSDGKDLDEFQKMWRIKQEDLVIKKKLSKMKLLDRLMAKQEPLDDGEEALKKKLFTSCCCLIRSCDCSCSPFGSYVLTLDFIVLVPVLFLKFKSRSSSCNGVVIDDIKCFKLSCSC